MAGRWMTQPIALIGMAMAALTGAGPAHAAKVIATYSGLVASGEDGLGLFGGGNLTGKAFVATFEYDFATAPGQPALLAGFGRMMSLITIAGKTAGVEASATASLFDNLSGRGDMVEHRLSDAFYFTVASRTSDFVSGIAAATPVDYLTRAGDERSGAFTRRQTRCSPFRGNCWEVARTDLRFNVQRVTVTPEAVAAVPEPTSWALMLAGFAVTAAALRRRTRRAVLAG